MDRMNKYVQNYSIIPDQCYSTMITVLYNIGQHIDVFSFTEACIHVNDCHGDTISVM